MGVLNQQKSIIHDITIIREDCMRRVIKYAFLMLLVLCSSVALAGTVTDIDGNVYQTVTIGNQVWMAENLKVTHYRNGDVIPIETDGGTWAGLTTGAYCEYNNDINNVATYGRLYNWHAVNDSRGVTPAGWHVPSDAEWQTLVDYLGGSTVAGGKMKETGTTHWCDPNTATNESGFSALPGGYRFTDGPYYVIGCYAGFWSSTESAGGRARGRSLNHSGYDDIEVYRFDGSKPAGFSIRCVKDPTVTDIDGNVYETVTIGSQVWMAENLKVTHYRNGEAIPNVTYAFICGDLNGDGKINLLDISYIIFALYRGGPQPNPRERGDVNNDSKFNLLDVSYIINFLYRQGSAPNCGVATWNTLTTGAYCEYNNDVNNVSIYGRLYNWYAVSDGRGIAPEGWHVPSDAEWKQLEMYLGMSQAQADATEWRGTTEGGKMKEAGNSHWLNPNTGATNESGFSALPGGYRSLEGTYGSFGFAALFWSSTEYNSNSAWDRALDCISSTVYRLNYYKSLGFSVRCVKDQLPELTTADVTEITYATAQSGGNITSDGGAAITVSGICWSTNPIPTVADNITTDGAGIGSFTSSLTGLIANTTYYVRAYATNSAGTGYGNEVSFTTPHETGTVTDIDGNTYQTVKIGDQWWMAENLEVTHYRNGEDVPNVTDNATWAGLTTGAYCEYNNDINNVAIYGRLYNWYAVADSRNIAPEGWHVPTDAEWKQLEMYLGMSQTEADATDWRGTTEGGTLKENGTTHWFDPNTGATNESGFSGLPGGYRNSGGPYYDIRRLAYLWSSTAFDSDNAWYRNLDYSNSKVARYISYKTGGFSIRCVKD
jgi:uncharacterized protein (TIGR02145 family)